MRLNQTGVERAVKIVSRRIDCSREVELLRRCQGHPNIVKLVEVMQVSGVRGAPRGNKSAAKFKNHSHSGGGFGD